MNDGQDARPIEAIAVVWLLFWQSLHDIKPVLELMSAADGYELQATGNCTYVFQLGRP